MPTDAKVGEVFQLALHPKFGYEHTDCRLARPAGLAATEEALFLMQLMQCYPKVPAVLRTDACFPVRPQGLLCKNMRLSEHQPCAQCGKEACSQYGSAHALLLPETLSRLGNLLISMSIYGKS